MGFLAEQSTMQIEVAFPAVGELIPTAHFGEHVKRSRRPKDEWTDATTPFGITANMNHYGLICHNAQRLPASLILSSFGILNNWQNCY
jgi:hypothetical protein